MCLNMEDKRLNLMPPVFRILEQGASQILLF